MIAGICCVVFGILIGTLISEDDDMRRTTACMAIMYLAGAGLFALGRALA
jgi:hypothetical protein